MVDLTSKTLALNLGFGAAGLMGLHQCLFPADHLRMFFLCPSFIEGKNDTDKEFRAAVEVMRWLGLANIAACALGRLLCSETKPSATVLAGTVGGICLFDVLFVKRVWFLEARDIVNPKIPQVVGTSLAVIGTTLIAYVVSSQA